MNKVTSLTLFLLISFSYSCKKSAKSSIDISQYTSKMGNTRIWSGNASHRWSSDTATVYEQIIDTSFAVGVNGNNTISFLGTTLSFSNLDKTTQTISFSYLDHNPADLMFITDQLTYYYQIDSMVYDGSSSHLSIESSLFLHTN